MSFFSKYIQQREDRISRWVFNSPIAEMADQVRVDRKTGEIIASYDVRNTPIDFDMNDIMYLYHFPPTYWKQALSQRYNKLLFDFDISQKQQYIIGLLTNASNAITEEEMFEIAKTSIAKGNDGIDESLKKKLEIALADCNAFLENRKNLNPKFFLEKLKLQLKIEGDQSYKDDEWSILQAIKSHYFQKLFTTEHHMYDPNKWSWVHIKTAGKGGERWYFVKSNIKALHTRITKPVGDSVISSYDNSMESRKEYLKKFGTYGMNLGKAIALYNKGLSIQDPEMAEDISLDVERRGAGYVGMREEDVSGHIQEWLRRIKTGFFTFDDISPEESYERLRAGKYANATEHKRLENTKLMKFKGDLNQFSFGTQNMKHDPIEYHISQLGNNPDVTREIGSPEYLCVNSEGLIQINNNLNQGRAEALISYFTAINKLNLIGTNLKKLIPMDRSAQRFEVNIAGGEIADIAEKMLYTIKKVGDTDVREIPSIKIGGGEKITVSKVHGSTRSEKEKVVLYATPLLMPSATTDKRKFNEWQKYYRLSNYLLNIASSHQGAKKEDSEKMMKLLLNPKKINEIVSNRLETLSDLKNQIKDEKRNLHQERNKSAQNEIMNKIKTLRRQEFDLIDSLPLLEELQKMSRQVIEPARQRALEQGVELDKNDVMRLLYTQSSKYEKLAKKSRDDSPLWDSYTWNLFWSHPEYKSAWSERHGMGTIGVTKGEKSYIGGDRELWNILQPYLGHHADTLTESQKHVQAFTKKLGTYMKSIYPVNAYATNITEEQYQNIISDLEKQIAQNSGLLCMKCESPLSKQDKQCSKCSQIVKTDLHRVKHLKRFLSFLLSLSDTQITKKIEQLLLTIRQKEEEVKSLLNEKFLDSIEKHIEIIKAKMQIVPNDETNKKIIKIKQAIVNRRKQAGEWIVKYRDFILRSIQIRNTIIKFYEKIKQNEISSNLSLENDQLKKIESDLGQIYFTFTGETIPNSVIKTVIKESLTSAEKNQDPKEKASAEKIAKQEENLQNIINECEKSRKKVMQLISSRKTLGDPKYFGTEESKISNGPIVATLNKWLKKNQNLPEAEEFLKHYTDLFDACKEFIIRNIGLSAFSDFAHAIKRGSHEDRLKSGYNAWEETKRLVWRYMNSIYQADICRGSRTLREQGLELSTLKSRSTRNTLFDNIHKAVKMKLVLAGLTDHSTETLKKYFKAISEQQEGIIKASKELNEESNREALEAIDRANGVFATTQNNPPGAKTEQLIYNIARSRMFIEPWIYYLTILGYSQNESEEIAKYLYDHHIDLLSKEIKDMINQLKSLADNPEEIIGKFIPTTETTTTESRNPITYRKDQIVKVMKSIMGSRTIPFVIGLTEKSDKVDASAPTMYNTNLLNEFNHNWSKYNDLGTQPTEQLEFYKNELRSWLQGIEKNQDKLKEYSQKIKDPEIAPYRSINTRMISDYILSVFQYKPRFYAYTQEQLRPNSQAIVPGKMLNTPASIVWYQATRKEQNVQIEQWIKALTPMKARISYDYAFCPYLRKKIDDILVRKVFITKMFHRQLVVVYRLNEGRGEELLQLLQSIKNDAMNMVGSKGTTIFAISKNLPCMASGHCNNTNCDRYGKEKASLLRKKYIQNNKPMPTPKDFSFNPMELPNVLIPPNQKTKRAKIN